MLNTNNTVSTQSIFICQLFVKMAISLRLFCMKMVTMNLVIINNEIDIFKLLFSFHVSFSTADDAR